MVTKLPLVSILIPVTQISVYFKATLTSALFQTYDNTEIIVIDSTSTNDIQLMVEAEFLPYYNKITYKKNNKSITTIQLLQELIQNSNGSYINFLSEKDLFYPAKIEKMMQCFLSDVSNTIQLVTSSQTQIDEKGQFIQNLNIRDFFMTDTKLNGIECGKAILQKQDWIGELTAPLFKKTILNEPFGYFMGTPFVHEYITATWLSMLHQGDVMYIADALSFKRNFQEQNLASIAQKNEWDQLFSRANQLGYLT
ncbi:glycosyltransferase family A protein [Bacillus toyonensis]|uniref:Glycosyl transferase family 2 n=1 Tax=Bacillus toyonensis TaxID=155322 RepID=A0A2A8HC40_9BACI|nr:glycosyltransferase family A protein [Bacillus toyonensis]PEQ02682.1 glycosyl transferase family 2 [Bacillus toyonensis]